MSPVMIHLSWLVALPDPKDLSQETDYNHISSFGFSRTHTQKAQ